MSNDVDVAVVGLGAMGSLSLWRLAARGARVAGFDRFDPPHDRGSSHGESRIIRTAYAEGAFYVPLLHEAFALWRALERDSGAELLTMTGALMIGPADGDIVGGSLASARAHHLDHQLLNRDAMARRFPQHVLAEGDSALWDAQAGVLRPEACINAALRSAQTRGATINRETQIATIEPDADSVVLHLAGGGRVRAGHCVIAAGSWTETLVPSLAVSIQVERQVLGWFELEQQADFTVQRFPVFVHELSGGHMRYGLPSLDGTTIKLAVHHEGATCDPDDIDRAVTDADLEPLRDFATTWLRGVSPRCQRSMVCMYTNTPDEHFLVGSPADAPRITVVGGCSGHSFKFSSVLGDVAADLALTGRTGRDIDAFRLDRATLMSA
jgi:sarcosine oxidase